MCRVKLGEVAIEHKETLSNDKVVLKSVGLEHLIPEEIKLKRWDENKSNTFNKVFRAGHVLFGRRRAYLKKAAITDFEGVCSGDITVIEAISDKIMPALLPFVIQNDDLFNYAMSNSAGSLSPRVKWAQLKEYEFNLPNLNEQKYLSDLLWAANDVKEAYQKMIELTDELVKAQFMEMFGDSITSDKQFPVRSWSEVLEIKNGRNQTIVIDKHGKYPIYGSGGVMGYAKDYLCPANTIVIGRKGTINKPIFVKERFWNVDTAFGVIPNEKMIHPQYLYEFCKQFNFEQLNRATVLPSLRKGDLLNIEMQIPPMELQLEYAVFVQQVNLSKAYLKQTLADIGGAMKSISKQFI